MASILTVLNQISNIKKIEVILPIAGKIAMVTPMTVGDDLALKTSILSPANLDMELVNLLYKHTEFVEPQIADGENSGGEKKFIKPKAQTFISELSHIDKLSLLWAIYKATYESLGKRKIRCDKCGEEWEEEILLDDIIQEDTYTLLETEKQPFTTYVEKITIPLDENNMLEFTVRIPSIKNHNNILAMITKDKIESNLEKIRSTLDATEMIALFTKTLAVYPKNRPEERTETSSIQEILAALNTHINLTTAKQFTKEYDEKFGKYAIKFYKKSKCQCGNEIKIPVDIDYEFFLRGLLDRESGE